MMPNSHRSNTPGTRSKDGSVIATSDSSLISFALLFIPGAGNRQHGQGVSDALDDGYLAVPALVPCLLVRRQPSRAWRLGTVFDLHQHVPVTPTDEQVRHAAPHVRQRLDAC